MLGVDAGLEELLRQQEERVICHIDMDCFYCEVERQRNPRLRGVPMAVLQYNPQDPRTVRPEDDRIFNNSDGSIIAVSYEARAKGVTRIMRGKEARRQCPELQCVQVPVAFSKADLSIYKDAGRTVIDVLNRYGESVFRASIDEAYVDISARAAALARRVASGAEPLLPPDAAPGDGGGGAHDGARPPPFGPGSASWSWVAGVNEPDGSETLSRAEVRNGHAKGAAQALAAQPPAEPEEAEEERLLGAERTGVGGALGGGAAAAAAADGGAARGALMQALREKAQRQQQEAQRLQRRAEARGGVGEVIAWWLRGPDEWRPAELLLACGARLVSEMRAAVSRELGFSCSAGIAHSMTLAKLGSSMHKPGMQTVLPTSAMRRLLHALPIERIKGLGGEVLGSRLRSELGVSTVGDLAAVPLSTLTDHFGSRPTGRSGIWLYRIARGIDLEPVKDEPLQQSHNVGKNFLRSRTGVLVTVSALRHWLSQLASQLVAILAKVEEEHGRVASKLAVHFAGDAAAAVYASGRSRTTKMPRPYSAERVVDTALAMIERDFAAEGTPLRVAVLSLTGAGMEKAPAAGSARIDDMLRRGGPAKGGAGAGARAGHAGAGAAGAGAAGEGAGEAMMAGRADAAAAARDGGAMSLASADEAGLDENEEAEADEAEAEAEMGGDGEEQQGAFEWPAPSEPPSPLCRQPALSAEHGLSPAQPAARVLSPSTPAGAAGRWPSASPAVMAAGGRGGCGGQEAALDAAGPSPSPGHGRCDGLGAGLAEGCLSPRGAGGSGRGQAQQGALLSPTAGCAHLTSWAARGGMPAASPAAAGKRRGSDPTERAQPTQGKYARLSADEIDAATLAELPEDVRRELLAELRTVASSQQQTQRQRGSGGDGGGGRGAVNGDGKRAASKHLAKGRAAAAGDSIASYFRKPTGSAADPGR